MVPSTAWRLQPPLSPTATGPHQSQNQLKTIHWPTMAQACSQPPLDTLAPGLDIMQNRSPWYQHGNLRTETHKAKLKPSMIALYKTANKLNYFDKHIFTLRLKDHLSAHSREQTAWINLVSCTVQQAKAKANHHTQHTQHDIHHFLACHPHTVQIDERHCTPRLPATPH